MMELTNSAGHKNGQLGGPMRRRMSTSRVFVSTT